MIGSEKWGQQLGTVAGGNRRWGEDIPIVCKGSFTKPGGERKGGMRLLLGWDHPARVECIARRPVCPAQHRGLECWVQFTRLCCACCKNATNVLEHLPLSVGDILATLVDGLAAVLAEVRRATPCLELHVCNFKKAFPDEPPSLIEGALR
eukprot:2525429-Prorocentrum_lima.AAC.1